MSFQEIVDSQTERKIARELRREAAKLERERRNTLMATDYEKLRWIYEMWEAIDFWSQVCFW